MADTGSQCYCVLEYRYRDAANWKTYGEALLTGRFSPASVRQIEALLDGDRIFVPEQIGLPPLQTLHACTYGAEAELDHAFHEFVGLRPATDVDLIASTPVCTVEDLIVSLLKVGGQWECGLSPYS